MPTPPASGLLLAGGASTRMGQDKAKLLLHGEPLWLRQHRTLRATGCEEILLARGTRDPLEGAETRCTLLSDAAENAGPLGALVAALRQLAGDWLVAVAVDVPAISAAFLGELLAASAAEGVGFIPELKGRLEPLAAVYPRDCLKLAERCLHDGKLSLQSFARAAMEAGLLRTRILTPTEAPMFLNVNTPAEWTQLQGDFPPINTAGSAR